MEFLVHGWDSIKNLHVYSLLGLSTHKHDPKPYTLLGLRTHKILKSDPTMTKVRRRRAADLGPQFVDLGLLRPL